MPMQQKDKKVQSLEIVNTVFQRKSSVVQNLIFYSFTDQANRQKHQKTAAVNSCFQPRNWIINFSHLMTKLRIDKEFQNNGIVNTNCRPNSQNLKLFFLATPNLGKNLHSVGTVNLFFSPKVSRIRKNIQFVSKHKPDKKQFKVLEFLTPAFSPIVEKGNRFDVWQCSRTEKIFTAIESSTATFSPVFG